MNDRLIELKVEYGVARGNLAQLQAQVQARSKALQDRIDELTAQFNAENAELLRLQEVTSEDVFAVERALRSAMEAAWLAEIEAAKAEGRKPSKQLAPGLSVRVTSRLVYAEEDALGWAKTNAPFLVRESVDKKQFETAIKSLSLPFVAVEEQVSTVIS